MPERKIFLDSEIRWKAFLRQQIRATYDLFHFGGYVTPKEHGFGLDGRRNIDERLRKDSHIKDLVTNARVANLQSTETPAEKGTRTSGQFSGIHGGVKAGVISLDMGESFNPYHRGELFRTAWHEIAHEQNANKFNRNDFALAHSLGYYFYGINFPSFLFEGNSTKDKKMIDLIEAAFTPNAKMDAIKRSKGSMKQAEYGPVFSGGKHSFADVGTMLGGLAVQMEWLIGVPGIGLVFIREVSRGRKISAVESSLIKNKQKYVRELTSWFKRHPSIRRFILESATSSRFMLRKEQSRKLTARKMLEKTQKPKKVTRKKR